MPSELVSEVELDDVAVEEAAEAMELVVTPPVAARSASDCVPTDVFGEVIAVGRAEVCRVVCLLVDLAEVEDPTSLFTDDTVLAFGDADVVGSGVASGAFEVSIATPMVVYPPISPSKVLEAVT
tara:strand:+ start:151 stop:522 length:372 start_codon:yes stop_codon:yes gene_type:complete